MIRKGHRDLIDESKEKAVKEGNHISPLTEMSVKTNIDHSQHQHDKIDDSDMPSQLQHNKIGDSVMPSQQFCYKCKTEVGADAKASFA
ncbi:hypothetical protein Q3G72_014771 [Acer saccharum]|nr:hypothetical protein Q3G72_014771 [Acer saccharum]